MVLDWWLRLWSGWGGWRCGWDLVINWVWGMTAGKWASKLRVIFFGGGPFIMSPLKREYMFLGAWMLGAQVRSGEFELSTGHQVDTGWSWVCIQRRSGLG